MGRGSHDIRLIDELSKHPGKTVLLGVRSSFFFIGPSEEAISDIRTVGLMAKLCVQLSTYHRISPSSVAKAACDIGSRKVVKTYVRNNIVKDDEIVILIEGKEFGSFWTRAEYLACRKTLADAAGLAPVT